MSPVAAAVSRSQAGLVNLNHPGRYLHWGVVQISLANLVVVLVMVALFAAALLIPFPGHGDRG